MTHHESAASLPQVFWDRVSRFEDRPVVLYKESVTRCYRSISWKELGIYIRETAAGLRSLGVRKGDRIGIMAENCPEWPVADFSILSLGAVTVPIYPTLSYKDVVYIAAQSELEILFVSTFDVCQQLEKIFDEKLKIRVLCAFEPVSVQTQRCLCLESLRRKGRNFLSHDGSSLEESVRDIDPEDLATIIFTSGTTGPPKGVMLTHGNFLANYLGCRDAVSVTEKDTLLSFLPLSHVFERLAGYYFPIFQGATIAYAESMQSVAEDLAEVKPTIVVSVPRLFEKTYARILEKVESAPRLRRNLFAWAVRVGRKFTTRRLAGRKVSGFLALQYGIAKILVFRKLKERLGGRIRFFISGGAPLSKELAEFFCAADVLILEGYGLTETSPVISVNRERHFKFGSVGLPLANVELKIGEEGEIVMRGPSVMKGYYKNESATQNVIREGWFHTGDIGEIDCDGFLRITDRIKDIIVTSGGKNISPRNIEERLLADRLFSQAVVIGEKRNYLVALIVPDQAELQGYAKDLNLEHLAWQDLLRHELIYKRVELKIQALTQDLARYEQIKYFALLDRELTQETGDLTPTLKLKRKIIQGKYQVIIEGLYRRGEGYGKGAGS